MSKVRIILTSVENTEMAQVMAKELAVKKLAACVQISAKGHSVYQWQGDVCIDDEHYLQIKTDKDHCEAVIQWLEENHPYDTPEILALKTKASRKYADWLQQCLS